MSTDAASTLTGWQLVPKLPTPEMIEAAWTAQPLGPVCNWDIEGLYRAMLAVAPSPSGEKP